MTSTQADPLDALIQEGDILIAGQAEDPYVDHIPRWCPACGQVDGSVPCAWPHPDAPLRTQRRIMASAQHARQVVEQVPCTRCGEGVEIYPFFLELLGLTAIERILGWGLDPDRPGLGRAEDRLPPELRKGLGPDAGAGS